MTQHEMKDFIRNSSAQPIKVYLTDGGSFKVSHPDFAFTTSGSLILASGPGHELNGEFVVCPLAQISRVEVSKAKSKTAKG
jgi:hypothetical protein